MLESITHRHEQGNGPSASYSAEVAANSSKAPKRRSSGLKFFASALSQDVGPPTTPPHKRWEREYIKDLRTNRPVRPSGSRPLPDRPANSLPDPFNRASSAMSFRPSLSAQQAAFSGEQPERSASALSHRRTHSDMPANETGSSNARTKLAHQLKSRRDVSTSTSGSKATVVAPSATYRDSGMRWMEKQEARSLREALEDMDARKNAKLQAAAQKEAMELVHDHLNGKGQSQAPNRRRSYREHLQKGAHARSQTQAWNRSVSGACVPGSRTVSGNSTSTASNNSGSREAREAYSPDTEPFEEEPKSHMEWDSPQKKAYMNLTFPFEIRKPSGRRRSSGPRSRDISGGLFRNPKDKIYEEPNEAANVVKQVDSTNEKLPLSTRARNTVSKIHTAGQPFLRSRQSSAEEKKQLNRSEIHKNPPSQSRDPSYTKNKVPEQKDAVEIRSDDIRAATSMQMKGRSPKLPSPTVVSDHQDRPIVSFDKNWVPKTSEANGNAHNSRTSGFFSTSNKTHMPISTASAPVMPTINACESRSTQPNPADDVFGCDGPSGPSISVNSVPVPSISLPDDASREQSAVESIPRPRPLPANRPLPQHSSTAPVHTSTPHWSMVTPRVTAQCAACALPIAGRIVTAMSQRFHPHCFTCHHCAEPLECVAFYPEPDGKREERLARIEARAGGELLDTRPGESALDDGDASMRFYCHLDFHEFFSPRCKSCKTPIESEVVVACGSTWHVGHFFCAECGDPFDPKTPFVEKNGYAWCVNCHAGKFSGKCKGCRKPVVTEGIRAIDADWHSECFICTECNGPFVDGKFFTREADPQKPVCVSCEEKRLKA